MMLEEAPAEVMLEVEEGQRAATRSESVDVAEERRIGLPSFSSASRQSWLL